MNRFLFIFSALFFAGCGQPGPSDKAEVKDTTQVHIVDTQPDIPPPAIPQYPQPKGFVNDFDAIFTPDQVGIMDSIIALHKNQTTNEIAIATTPASYFPKDSLNQYAFALFNNWGIGTKEKNNGIGILFCKAYRQVRIEVGKGLEKKLTNEKCQSIIDDHMIPFFKKGYYFEGIKEGLTEIINCLSKPE